jgi:cyclopropane fatty-acyl-phospholipid synthase-like methyltransferase
LQAAAEGGEAFYYDTDDAYNFYQELWGGEHLHVGIYPDEISPTPESVAAASEKALETLLDLCAPAFKGKSGGKAMDMGAAYGGCAREMVKKYGCKVVCIELSKKENELNVQRNKEQGLEEMVIVPGELSFDDTKEESGTFDCVVSEDSILHAGKGRPQVVAEAARVLRKGGLFVFSDPMQRDCIDTSQLSAVYARIGLDDMGSPANYVQWAAAAGMRFKRYVDFSEQIGNHYGTLKALLQQDGIRQRLKGKVSDKYVEAMITGLEV